MGTDPWSDVCDEGDCAAALRWPNHTLSPALGVGLEGPESVTVPTY